MWDVRNQWINFDNLIYFKEWWLMPSSHLSSYTVCKDCRAEGDGEVSLQICLNGLKAASPQDLSHCMSLCLRMKRAEHALSCPSREHLKLLLPSFSCAFCYHAINCTHSQRTCGYCTVPYVSHTSLLFRTEPYFWWIPMFSKFCHWYNAYHLIFISIRFRCDTHSTSAVI